MEIKKVNEFTWEIKKQGKMRVPAIIYASEKLMQKIKEDRTLQQAMNVATLKGIQRASYTMPDAHEGYGFPIGGVAAFDMDEGIISPGGVGYDICCGVRLLQTNWNEKDILAKKKELLNEIFKEVPAGVGRKGITKLSKDVLFEVLEKGAEWALENDYGTKDDLDRTEENGRMKSANVKSVSERALERGMPQLGTLGSGNHFLEIQKVDKIFNKEVAEKFGIKREGQICLMIHCGSRGLGHQVASDYIKKMETEYGVKDLADRELVNAPIQSELGKKYYEAMACSVNYAFSNRQLIAHWVRDVFKKIMGSSDEIKQVYDVAHNICKREKHMIDGKENEVYVTRKGATRSFGPGREEIPEVYRSVGQPVIIPASMGSASYLLAGTKKAEEISWASVAHGAGRVMSRHEALRRFRGEKLVKELEQQGIYVKGGSLKGLAEEASGAYKDCDEVVRVSHELGIGNLVCRLFPLAVMKG